MKNNLAVAMSVRFGCLLTWLLCIGLARSYVSLLRISIPHSIYTPSSTQNTIYKQSYIPQQHPIRSIKPLHAKKGIAIDWLKKECQQK